LTIVILIFLSAVFLLPEEDPILLHYMKVEKGVEFTQILHVEITKEDVKYFEEET